MMKALKFAMVGTLVAALTACSTVQTRRDDAPTFAGSTPKTLVEFEDCFGHQFDGSSAQPSFLPTAKGGTYTARTGLTQEYVIWVLDLEDAGQERKVTLHAIDSIWGKDKKLISKVQACL